MKERRNAYENSADTTHCDCSRNFIDCTRSWLTLNVASAFPMLAEPESVNGRIEVTVRG